MARLGPKRLACVATGAAIILLGATSRAEDRRGARLVWARDDGAQECVGLAGLEEDVRARLGYDPFALAPDIEVEGVVVGRKPRGHEARLVFRDRSGATLGARRFASGDKSCRSLGEAVAVAITVAIDPQSEAVRKPPPLEEPPEPEPPPPPPPPVEDRPRGRASLGIGPSAGLVPGVGLVAVLRASALLGPHAEIGAGSLTWPETSEAGLAFGIAAGEVRGCWRGGSALVLRLCAGALAGVFQAHVRATDVLAPVDVGLSPWVAVEVEPALAVRLGRRWELEGAAGAVVPIVRRQAFLRNGEAPVWEESAVGGQLTLALAAVF